MSENKHYGRQILLSLFITVFILLGLLYLASRYLLPLYSVNQEQIYDVLVKLFPLLIGLVMIEIGVLVARKRDEDYADEVDKLPPNAYDKPFYTLPGDDPAHRHSDEMAFSQPLVSRKEMQESSPAPEDELIAPTPVIREVMQPTYTIAERAEKEEVAPITTAAVVENIEPVAEVAIPAVTAKTYSTDFASMLSLELENAQEMDYDLTLVLIDVSHGPAEQIANKMLMLSGELAYSFSLPNSRIAMILPFYNAEEARSFTLSLIDSCKKEFSGSSLQIGFASRNGRVLDSSLLLHEAEAACVLEEDENQA